MSFDYGLCAFLFIVFNLCHYIGDYWLQTDYTAKNKGKSKLIRFTHAGFYTVFTFMIPSIWISVLVASTNGLLIIGCAVAIALSHYLIDDRKFVLFWMTEVMGASDVVKIATSDTFHPLNYIMQHKIITLDQSLHKIVLFVVAVILTCYS